MSNSAATSLTVRSPRRATVTTSRLNSGGNLLGIGTSFLRAEAHTWDVNRTCRRPARSTTNSAWVSRTGLGASSMSPSGVGQHASSRRIDPIEQCENCRSSASSKPSNNSTRAATASRVRPTKRRPDGVSDTNQLRRSSGSGARCTKLLIDERVDQNGGDVRGRRRVPGPPTRSDDAGER